VKYLVSFIEKGKNKSFNMWLENQGAKHYQRFRSGEERH